MAAGLQPSAVPHRRPDQMANVHISPLPPPLSPLPYLHFPRVSPPSVKTLTRPLAETKNTYHLADPSFTYLLSSFQLLTGLAWGIASTTSVGATIRLTLIFIFVHFLLGSLVVATAAYFLVGRLLGPRSSGGRRKGLFGDTSAARDRDRDRERGEEEGLEFGYCFDVSLSLTLGKGGEGANKEENIGADEGEQRTGGDTRFLSDLTSTRISLFVGNTLYLVAFIYYTIIVFLGYNALPFLHHTELLLSPTFVYGILWFASLFGFNIPKHIGPLLVLGAR
ncbi:MAG: hypothetical protein LQ338_003766 [Usnochroma carphineum]|nr:MAG: hypothetical protein LQ338_003766 [Usnochroma carphineum]